jgi:hypothetical protein
MTQASTQVSRRQAAPMRRTSSTGREIEVTTPSSDLSADDGFRFELHCMRCGSGYRTESGTVEPSAATNVLDGASGLLGGVFGRAAAVAQRAKSAAWEKASDKSLVTAQQEILPKFVQCPRCSAWMYRGDCWNEKKGLCRQCAPDPGAEMAAAQASRSIEEVWAHARLSEKDKHLTERDWREGIVASCPTCGRRGRPTPSSAPTVAPISRRRSTAPVRGEAPARRQVLQRVWVAQRLSAKTGSISRFNDEMHGVAHSGARYSSRRYLSHHPDGGRTVCGRGSPPRPPGRGHEEGDTP